MLKRMEKPRYIPADNESLAAHIDKKRGSMQVNEFAEFMGTSTQVVNQWKRGEGLPRPTTIEKLGLRPCYEVVDDTPFTDPKTAPVPKSREDLMMENSRLKAEIIRLKKDVSALKAGGKKSARKA